MITKDVIKNKDEIIDAYPFNHELNKLIDNYDSKYAYKFMMAKHGGACVSLDDKSLCRLVQVATLLEWKQDSFYYLVNTKTKF
jgi:hypothetical protein